MYTIEETNNVPEKCHVSKLYDGVVDALAKSSTKMIEIKCEDAQEARRVYNNLRTHLYKADPPDWKISMRATSVFVSTHIGK